jgi:hypothetical protein
MIRSPDVGLLAEKVRQLITLSCNIASALCVFAAFILFTGCVRFQIQEPPLAAIDRAPYIPWWAPAVYVLLAAGLFYLPKILRRLDRFSRE